MKLPMPAPDLSALFEEIDIPARIAELIKVSPLYKGQYLHWDELRHREPPAGLTHREWWAGVKLARSQTLKPIALLFDKNRKPFFYNTPDPVLRLLHEIDQHAAGGIEMPEPVTNPATRDRYIISSLIEESITSSQLEGASTTGDVARNMLRSGRPPIDRSERMILNNFRAMRFVQEHSRSILTPEIVFELHRIITEGTLTDSLKAGRFRDNSDNVIVEDGLGNKLHVPPDADELTERLERMCAFANERQSDVFVHPAVRSLTLHFWVGYDHPFVDGNGRVARALFYWSMLSQRYWLAEYLSISRILKKAPAKYMQSFVFTETDANDLTYFLIYQLAVIRKAIDELQEFLQKKVSDIRRVQGLLRRSADFNHRQLAILSHALKHPGMQYTIQSHQTSHNVVYETARSDLLGLVRRGLLTQRKRGRAYTFNVPENLAELLPGG